MFRIEAEALGVLVFLGGVFIAGGGSHGQAAPSKEGKEKALSSGSRIAEVVEWTAPAALADATIMRSRPVTIRSQPLAHENRKPGDLVPVDLFGDASFTAVVERVEQPSQDRRILSGRLLGEPGSSFTLVVRGGVVAAAIRIPGRGESYQVRSLADGTHVIRQIDEGGFPPCGVDAEPALQGHGAAAIGAALQPEECVEDGSVIDVLVVYTPAARQAEGGTVAMEALIDLSLAETNTAFGNSLINTRLRLAHAAEVAYDESIGMSDTLYRLREPADGYLDEVHDLRDQHGADMVALLIEGGGYCGIAYVMQTLSHDFEAKAFSVTGRTCAAGNLTFAHELGHNLGCAHNREDTHAAGLYSYAYGYWDPNEVFRTVMAYNCPGNCPRVRYFSNPDVRYNGLVTGNSLTHAQPTHNALTINQSAQTTACFRQADCNNNGIPDSDDIANETSEDCSGNGVPDECEPDCNSNGEADSCDILGGSSEDCDSNSVPDECEGFHDCNGNGMHDPCDIRDSISDDCNGNWIPDECLSLEDDCNENLVPDSCDIDSQISADCNENGVPDECDLASGTSGDCNGNNTPDECDVADGVSADCNTNGVLDLCEITLGILPDVDESGVLDACEVAVLFVDADATGLNYGLSWTDAFTNLQDALAIAAEPTNALAEIWVADGTYTPSRRTDPDDIRSVTFHLYSGVAVYGGFAGGETTRKERAPAVNVTILSGDLIGDDGPDFTNYQDNAYHVVTGSEIDATAILDGLTIRAGNADGESSPFGNDAGGAINNYMGSPTVSGCVIEWNYAGWGAGMYNDFYSDPLVINCVFRNNAKSCMANSRSSPTVRDCTFIENSTTSGGGAVYNITATPAFINCRFFGNSASYGGAICNNRSSMTITNCIFTGNTANSEGGAIRNQSTGSMTVTSSTFSGNTARTGGALHIGTADATVSNSIFWGNRQSNSGGLEQAQITLGNDGFLSVDYSLIQGWTGGLGGVGNIGSNPLFVDSDGPDGIYGSMDDNVRLSPGSPGIDAGDNMRVPVDVLDLDGDGDISELIPLDLDGYPRVVNIVGLPDAGNGIPPIVDMGAYEHHTDCNSNGIPDEQDIAGGTSDDCNDTGIPDECEGGDSWHFSGFALVPVSATGGYVYKPVCNEIIMWAGETVTLEIQASGWDPNLDGEPRLKLFSAAIDPAGFSSGAAGSLDFTSIPCLDDTDCFRSCGADGFCDFRSTLYVDGSRSDYVFFLLNSIYDSSSTLLAVGGVLLSSGEAVVDPGVPKYVGTLILDASSDALGSFTVGLSAAGETYLHDQDNASIPTPNLVPATITVVVDCNGNGVADDVDIANATSQDCNGNSVPDECDVYGGTSEDCDGNGVPDECQSDCDEDGTVDACALWPIGASADCNDNAVPDECDIDGGVSQDCNTNGVPDECEEDCNGNGVLDECDVASGTSEDLDGNGIPDECDRAPIVVADGSRYLAVTPVEGADAVALLVTMADHPCVSKYVNADGFLVGSPVFQTPDEWRTVRVHGEDIVPDAMYYVTGEFDSGLPCAAVRATTARWGDAVGGRLPDGTWEPPDGSVDIVRDAIACLLGFQNLSIAPPLEWCDLSPVIPDGVISIVEVMYIVDAFVGLPYPFDRPGPCP